MADKTEQRKSLLARRRAMTVQQRTDANAALCAHLLAWLGRHPAGSIGVYLAIGAEPDLAAAYEMLAASDVRLALPVVRERDAALVFVPWSPGEKLGRDICGIPVPAVQGETVTPELLLLPCVGFDQAGFRLGYGAGYYDRTLAGAPRPRTLGIAYASALAVFDVQAHDIALDQILTDRGPATGIA